MQLQSTANFVFVCLSQKPHVQTSRNDMLRVTVARCFSDGINAIRHVLPVLWMTSCHWRIVHRDSPGSATYYTRGDEFLSRSLPCYNVQNSLCMRGCHLSVRLVYYYAKCEGVESMSTGILTVLITGTRRCEHTAPVLQKLHWLPVHQRVEFKLACLVHQSLAEQTPSYLASDIQLTTNTGRPRL